MEPITTKSPAMTLREAAAYLCCTVSWVRILINRGELSYQQQGKHYVVRRREVEELLERGWHRLETDSGKVKAIQSGRKSLISQR
jgi:excisionase family DNA binding protein